MPVHHTLRSILACCVLAASAASTAVASPPRHAIATGAERTLTVATFNIHHGADRFDELDLERIAHDIDAFDADVVALQEVDNHWGERSGHVDQAAWLAERLDMHHCYAANLDREPTEGRAERRQYGTAFLSRLPLADCKNTPLPNHEGGEQRGLASARVTVRGVPVSVYNTHLTHTSAEYRTLQFDVVNRQLEQTDGPAVVMGDLNATPTSPEYAEFTERLVDVWPASGIGDGLTYAPGNPNSRIDYVLTTPDISPSRAVMPLVESSDHYPVVAELTLPHPGKVHGRG